MIIHILAGLPTVAGLTSLACLIGWLVDRFRLPGHFTYGSDSWGEHLLVGSMWMCAISIGLLLTGAIGACMTGDLTFTERPERVVCVQPERQ